MAFVRILCLKSKEDIEKLTKKNDEEEEEDKVRDLLNDTFKDDELDKKAFGYIETRCSLLLKSYPTSLEKDNELLKEGKLGPNQTHCVLLRRDEKVILNHVVAYCQEKRKVLESSS